MRAYEFISEATLQKCESRIAVPRNKQEIEIRKKQYELLKKRAEWLNKMAEYRKKMADAVDKNNRVVKSMAINALKKRSNGIYGLREKNV